MPRLSIPLFTLILFFTLSCCSQYGSIYQSDATHASRKESSSLKIVRQLQEGFDPQEVIPRQLLRRQNPVDLPRTRILLQRQEGVAPWLTREARAEVEAFSFSLFVQGNNQV